MRAFMIVACVLFVCICVSVFNPKAAYTFLETSHLFFAPEESETVSRKGAGETRRAHITPYIKKTVAYKQGWRCSCGCGESLKPDYHIDHKIPLWKWKGAGDANGISNLQALNSNCHSRKTALEHQDRRR